MGLDTPGLVSRLEAITQKIDSINIELENLQNNNPDFNIRLASLYANKTIMDHSIFLVDFIILLELFGISFEGFSDSEKLEIAKYVEITMILDSM